MLVLTGLPTLFPKLVEARTFSERMFRVVTLDRLSDDEQKDAILIPIQVSGCPITFDDTSVETISADSGGYPYFIQFICREVFDIFIRQLAADRPTTGVPVQEIQRKLDTDFFSGRWSRVSDRRRELLWVAARLEKNEEEFTIQEIVDRSGELLVKPFRSSHINQMLSKLADQGLIYKNRFGRYSFAVPLLAGFILRTYKPPNESLLPS